MKCPAVLLSCCPAVLLSCCPAVLLIAVVCPKESSADEMYSTQECTHNTGGNPNFDSIIEQEKKIHVYVQADFGQRMIDCINEASGYVPTGQIFNLPASTRNSSVHNVIASAVEVWNMESTGAVLQYEGPLAGANADSVCSQMQKPAVFVRFHNGCWPDGPGCHPLKPVAGEGEFFGAQNCPSTTELVFWGDDNAQNICNFADGPVINGVIQNSIIADLWSIDTNTFFDMQGMAVHEFGHVLNYPDGPPATSPGESVMHSGETLNPSIGRHLFPYDKDCVNDVGLVNANGDPVKKIPRELKTYRKGFNSSGNPVGSVYYTTKSVRKTGRTGGGLVESGANKYAIYEDNRLSVSSVTSNGYLSFLAKPVFPTWSGSPAHDLIYFYDQPVLASLRDTSHDYGIIYPNVSRSSINMPAVRYAVDSGSSYFSSSSSNDSKYLGWCLNSQSCSALTSVSLRSHIPVVTAWDHKSFNTIFVEVDTWRTTNFFNVVNSFGDIRVYPGIRSDSLYNTYLYEGSALDDNQTPPADAYTNFNFQLQTDSAPGVACAGGAPWFGQQHNCILAWVDHGIMEKRILYTFFQVNGQNQVEWITGTPNVWGLGFGQNVASVSHVSAAHFSDRFWIAWKSLDNDVCYMRTAPLSPVWDNPVCLGRSKVVDPPSWHYVPSDGVPSSTNHEAALVWGEHN